MCIINFDNACQQSIEKINNFNKVHQFTFRTVSKKFRKTIKVNLIACKNRRTKKKRDVIVKEKLSRGFQYLGEKFLSKYFQESWFAHRKQCTSFLLSVKVQMILDY
jgi:hypothetical protein